MHYPGLPEHPQHALASKQFGERFGTIVTFQLAGGRAAADAFIAAAKRIPFCPSLGELSTTLSHPETTSHRGMTAEQRAALGITGGTIRLSVGTESASSFKPRCGKDWRRYERANKAAAVVPERSAQMNLTADERAEHWEWAQRFVGLVGNVRFTAEPALFVSNAGATSQMIIEQFDGGRDAQYFVVSRKLDKRPGAGLIRTETVPPRQTIGFLPQVAGTDIIYDVTDETLQGKCRPFVCDLASVWSRVYALLPLQIETIELASSTTPDGRTAERRVPRCS